MNVSSRAEKCRITILICGLVAIVILGISAVLMAQRINGEDLLRQQLGSLVIQVDRESTKLEVLRGEFARQSLEMTVRITKLEERSDLTIKLMWAALIGIGAQIINAAARIILKT